MYRLWREDPEQWLIRSKIAWSKRHESKRKKSHARADVPRARQTRRRRPRTTNTSKRAAGAAGALKPAGRVTVSLKMLVDAGIMTPGPDAVFLSYLGQTWSGELDAAGLIRSPREGLPSPSAWAIFCKRIANPGKKADDGWKSVRYGAAEGPVLDELKQEYLTGVKPVHAQSARAGSSAKKTAPSARRARTAKRRADSDDATTTTATTTIATTRRTTARNIARNVRERMRRKPRRRRERRRRRTRRSRPARSDFPAASPSPADMSWVNLYPDATEGKPERDARARMVSPGEEYARLVGRVAQVYWPPASSWYTGRVLRHDGDGRVSVLYASGDVEQGVRIDLLSAQRMFCVFE